MGTVGTERHHRGREGGGQQIQMLIALETPHFKGVRSRFW